MVNLADLSHDIKESCLHGDTPASQERVEGTKCIYMYIYMYQTSISGLAQCAYSHDIVPLHDDLCTSEGSGSGSMSFVFCPSRNPPVIITQLLVELKCMPNICRPYNLTFSPFNSERFDFACGFLGLRVPAYIPTYIFTCSFCATFCCFYPDVI